MLGMMPTDSGGGGNATSTVSNTSCKKIHDQKYIQYSDCAYMKKKSLGDVFGFELLFPHTNKYIPIYFKLNTNYCAYQYQENRTVPASISSYKRRRSPLMLMFE